MPGLNAAFVDIGHEKDAFLHYQDLGPQFSSLNRYLKLVFEKRGSNPDFKNLNVSRISIRMERSQMFWNPDRKCLYR